MDVLTYEYIVFPMASLVLLTFGLLLLLFRSRAVAVKTGTVSAGYFKTYVGAGEPEASRKMSRHFTNLFEAPVLFYVVCLAGLALEHSQGMFQVLAWGYVLLRVVHAFAHLGRNKLIPRIGAYFSSWLVLLSMWALLIYRILV